MGLACQVFRVRVCNESIFHLVAHSFTYDHRTMRIRLPVRSAIYKHCTGGLVVRWVTTSESPLLYVFALFAMMICLDPCRTEEGADEGGGDTEVVGLQLDWLIEYGREWIMRNAGYRRRASCILQLKLS